MHDLGEFLRLALAPTRWLGLSGRTSSGKARFDLGIAPAQRVIVGIADRRRVFAVIAPVVLGDLVRQAVELLLRFGRGELVDRLSVLMPACVPSSAARAASAISRLAAARASSVTAAPDSMRAISSSRASSSSSSIVVLSFARRDAEMPRGAGRDLRRMGDQQDLGGFRQALQPFAHRIGHRAADAAIDFVEHQRGGRRDLGQRHLQRQREARQLAARCDLRQRAEGGAFHRRDFEGDAFQTRAPRLVVVQLSPAPRGIWHGPASAAPVRRPPLLPACCAAPSRAFDNLRAAAR